MLKYNLYTFPSKLKSPSTSHTNNTPITSRSVSRLGQALYTVPTDSKINVINTTVVNRSLFEQLQNITKSFNDPHKLIGKNIALQKFYRYSLTQKTLQSSEDILIKASSSFPKVLKPFMLFTTIANTISNNTIALPSTWINIYKSTPYFVLVSALLDSNMKIFLNDAFAVPIYSTNLLMPLESNYERTILKIILK